MNHQVGGFGVLAVTQKKKKDVEMTYKEYKFNLKRKIAKKLFQDVMDVNSRTYLSYLREPTKGIKELYDIAKTHLLDDLESDLRDGMNDSHLYDGLYEFYRKTPLYDFSSMHYELTNYFIGIISDFEHNSGNQVDKENLYLLRTLLQITASNTIEAMASWELANQEKQRKTGVNISISDLINTLPEHTITKPLNNAYSNNLFISSMIIKYPTLVNSNLKNLIFTLSGTDAIGLLSCGLRNVQVIDLIKSNNNSLQINKLFAQEIINSLCILNESVVKDYPQVTLALPRKKDRQIGKMLSPIILSTINPGVSTILGDSTSGYSGLYASEQLLADNQFNTQFPLYIDKLMTNTMSIDEFKAHVLLGIHALRNKVLHDYDDTLCYYSDSQLFIKTVGLLFVGVSVTKNL